MAMIRVLLSICLAFAFACSKKKSEPAASEAPVENAEPAKPAIDPGNLRKPQVRRVLTPITVDEAKPLIPTIAGARVIKEPQKAQHGERVEASWCFDAELTATGENMRVDLEKSGWLGAMVRQNPKMADRMNVSAKKEPFVLTGSVQRGAFADCTADKGQTLVTINVHKQAPRPAGMPAGPNPGIMRPLPGDRPSPPGLQRPAVAPQPAPVAPEAPKTP